MRNEQWGRQIWVNRFPTFFRVFAIWVMGVCAMATATMALAACLTIEVEPNNTDTTANAGICSGVSVTGSLNSLSDYD